jgi:hypothetical protein
MKYTVAFLLSFLLYNSTTLCQTNNGSFEFQLTGTDRTKWVFEKLERTMGDRKAVKDTSCGSAKFASIILAIQGNRYFAGNCKDTTTSRGNWILTQRNESYTLKLDKEYDVKIYFKQFGNRQRKYMLLRIRGVRIDEESQEFTYYAQ